MSTCVSATVMTDESPGLIIYICLFVTILCEDETHVNLTWKTIQQIRYNNNSIILNLTIYFYFESYQAHGSQSINKQSAKILV